MDYSKVREISNLAIDQEKLNKFYSATEDTVFKRAAEGFLSVDIPLIGLNTVEAEAAYIYLLSKKFKVTVTSYNFIVDWSLNVS